jgi:hypothetical protein
MSSKQLSKRLLKGQLRYAIHGIGIGLTASVVVILGTIMIVRFSTGRYIGHLVPFGFVLFTTIFVLMVYRLRYLEPEPEPRRITRSVTYGAVTELSERDKTKSA